MTEAERRVHVGSYVKQKRLELNMSQQSLAEKVGYSTRGSINKIEAGLNDIPYKKIELFAKALACDTKDLMPVELFNDNLTDKEQTKNIDFNRLAEILGNDTLINLSKAVDDIDNFSTNDYLKLFSNLSDSDLEKVGALIQKIIELKKN